MTQKSKIRTLREEIGKLIASEDFAGAEKKGKEMLSHLIKWMDAEFEHGEVPYKAVCKQDLFGNYEIGLRRLNEKDNPEVYGYGRLPLLFKFKTATTAAAALDLINQTLRWLGFHDAEECMLLENGLEVEETL